MSLAREELVYMSKVSEQTERFDDMLSYMKQVVHQKNELSVEERNLLSVAYKNSVGSRRTAWRALEAIEQKEESKGGRHTNLIREFKKKVKEELDGLCNDVLNLITNNVLPHCGSPESKVFFLKMKGDYYRYLAECSNGEQQTSISQGGLQAYQEATTIANSDLKETNPIRLGLALNFSVFYYEILNNPTQACSLAKQAFDDAIAKIEELNDDEYKDSTTIMQLIRDNLTLWSSELEGEGEEEGNADQ
jgi:14-3-3 protein epsilon